MSDIEGTFVDQFLRGAVKPSDIERFIERWHESEATCSLGEYLGLTEREYARWVEDPQTLGSVLSARERAKSREWTQAFGLLSDPTRLGILTEIARRPRNVTALCKALRLKQPTVSHHLGLLRMGRLVTGVRQGKVVVYTANKAALKALASGLAALMPR